MSNATETNTTPTSDEDSMRDMMQREAASRKVSARAKMLEAIRVVRNFMDDAEREAKRDGDPLHRRVSEVHRIMAWGLANASNELQAAAGYAHEAEVLEAGLNR